MPAPAGPARTRSAAALLAALLGLPAVGTAQNPVLIPDVLPAGAAESVPLGPPPAAPFDPAAAFPPTPLDAAPGLPNPNPAIASATPVEAVLGTKKPLPGSLADQVARDYAAREALRSCTWRGTTWTFLPNTLLWEPPLAVRKDPRMMAEADTVKNYKDAWSLDTSIGTTVGLFRAEPQGSDFKAQTDIFGVVHTRLTPEDVELADYRVGVPFTFGRGPWAAKFGYEHTSAHLGDRPIMANAGIVPIIYARDEIVGGLSYTWENRLRVYVEGAHAFAYVVRNSNNKRDRFDFGFEYYDRGPTGLAGTPYAAANLEYRGDQSYAPNFDAQLGWIWRNPEARLSSFRVFAEYYTGRSPYGQLYRDKENFYAVGIAGDY